MQTNDILVFLKNMIPIPVAYVGTSQSKLEKTYPLSSGNLTAKTSWLDSPSVLEKHSWSNSLVLILLLMKSQDSTKVFLFLFFSFYCTNACSFLHTLILSSYLWDMRVQSTPWGYLTHGADKLFSEAYGECQCGLFPLCPCRYLWFFPDLQGTLLAERNPWNESPSYS